MVNNNSMTGYTYLRAFCQAINVAIIIAIVAVKIQSFAYRLKIPVARAKALTSPGVIIPLTIPQLSQCRCNLPLKYTFGKKSTIVAIQAYYRVHGQ